MDLVNRSGFLLKASNELMSDTPSCFHSRYDCATMKDAHEGAYPQFPDFKVNMPVGESESVTCTSLSTFRLIDSTHRFTTSDSQFVRLSERRRYQMESRHL